MLKDIVNSKEWTPPLAELINLLIENGEQTIAELSQKMGVSVPYTTKILNELIEMGLVEEKGKKINYSKRAPRIYDLAPTSGYFLGIDIGKGYLKMGICDLCGNMIDASEKQAFEYTDNQECFDQVVALVNSYIETSRISKDQIQSACLSIGGRVNPALGRAYTFFTSLDKPLAEAMTERLGFPVCIDNDSRCMTYGEYLKGVCKGVKNVVFVNVSWGIGIGIIIDGKLYQGNSGFSGEIGHVHIYNNGIICHCGKVGCMETETSGSTLQRKMTEQILAGAPSILTDKVINKHQELKLDDILEAIKKEDVLSIGLLQKVALELGNNLAGIINIFNPKMLVIGGDLSVTKDYLTQPICMSIKKYSLNFVNEDSKITTSVLKDQGALIGACLMARSKIIQNEV